MQIIQTLILVIAIILTGQLFAVEPGMPSKTSIGAAAARAVGSHDPDPSIRNPDWLAERLLGPAERALLAGGPMEKALEQDYRDAMQRPEVAALVHGLLLRTRLIDERLKHAVRAGAKQIVILGAGFDSRAYRLKQLLTNTRVFEIDYGPTQEYKKRRVLEVLGGVPSNLVYAPIDFTKEKLGDVLRAAGYRPAEKTFFIWEGVSMYLPEEAVRATLLFVSTHSVPGSSIVFDFLSKSFVDSLAQAREESARSDAQTVSRQIAGRVAAGGEPWIFGIPDNGEREFLQSAGLEATRFLATRSSEATKQYATRRDGSTIQIPPLTGRPYYWLTEAVVPVRDGR
jgi:methyltransferase (TIGR00027 family)